MSDPRTLLDFLAFSENLKTELRHSWLSSGRQESVAEHCWQMALMAMLVHRHLAQPVDLGKTLKMILTHDLVEAEAGDVPFFEQGERKATKAARERVAIEGIRTRLGDPVGTEMHDLWQEFEARATPEAWFATALDQLKCRSSTIWPRSRPGPRSSTIWSTPRWTATAPTTRSSPACARRSRRRPRTRCAPPGSPSMP